MSIHIEDNGLSIDVRTIRNEDLAEVLAIEQMQNSPWSEGQLKTCFGPPYVGLVLESDQKIIGFIIWFVAADICEIVNIAIAKEYQRQGYGYIIFNAALNEVGKQGVKEVYLEVRVSNIAAIALYHKLGFVKVGVRKEYYLTDIGSEDGFILKYEISQ